MSRGLGRDNTTLGDARYCPIATWPDGEAITREATAGTHNDPSIEHRGNTGAALFDGWVCAYPTAVASARYGYYGSCTNDARGITLTLPRS